MLCVTSPIVSLIWQHLVSSIFGHWYIHVHECSAARFHVNIIWYRRWHRLKCLRLLIGRPWLMCRFGCSMSWWHVNNSWSLIAIAYLSFKYRECLIIIWRLESLILFQWLRFYLLMNRGTSICLHIFTFAMVHTVSHILTFSPIKVHVSLQVW